MYLLKKELSFKFYILTILSKEKYFLFYFLYYNIFNYLLNLKILLNIILYHFLTKHHLETNVTCNDYECE